MEMTENPTTAMRYIQLQGINLETDEKCPDNAIVSSKYTKLNFLPKSILMQFANPAKVWFLMISILELSSLNEEITINFGTVLPLLIIICIEAIREGYNDYLRHSSDSLLNSAQYPVWDGKVFVLQSSKDIRVGNIVLLYNNDFVPADLLIIASGNVDHECYMEASTILGEASLKIKHAVKEVQLIIESLDVEEASTRLKKLNEDLHVSLPNSNFKQFKGKLKLRSAPKSSKLSLENILYRGSRITNTPWIFGVAVYTGIETKAWINNLNKHGKSSKIKSIIDKWILMMFPIIIAVCVINTIVSSIAFSSLPYSWSNVLATNFILFGHAIPISLFLSIEVIRLFYLIYFQKLPSIKVNSTELFSNLGMVEYIVADKTGTITENNLRIIFCVVLGKVYWDGDSPAEVNSPNAEVNYAETFQLNEKNDDISLLNDLADNFNVYQDDKIMMNYLICMAVCNLAFSENDDYVAMTVDDKELARTAAMLGVKLLRRDTEICVLSIAGKETVYDVIGFQQFSSIKKKSRIVVRNRENSKISLYVKGSRESLLELYAEDHNEDDVYEGYRTIYMGFKEMTENQGKAFMQEYLTAKHSPINREGRIDIVFEQYERQLEYLGIVGLQDSVSYETQETVRLIKRAGIKLWLLSGDSEESTLSAALAADMYLTADPVLSLSNLTSELDFLNVVQDYIHTGIFQVNMGFENNASISDQIYIEEKVDFSENEVINTHRISSRKHGTEFFKKMISFKNSTSFASNEFPLSKSRLVSRGRNSTVNPFVAKLKTKVKLKKLKQVYQPNRINYVISVDSTGIDYAMNSKQNRKYFISLIFAAKFVCFHSLFPDDKKKVVQMLMNNLSFRPLVLSVGDGISDIGMIQAADIGVGIDGKEGSDAANSSDISIKHFSQLKNLLLIHGHRNYILFSKLILLSFYAMTLIEVELFLCNCFSGFSTFSLIQKEFVVIYRLVISILPVSVMCMLDNDSKSTEITPQAFKAGIFNTMLTKKNLAMFSFLGFLQAIVTFIFMVLYFDTITDKGYVENWLVLGSTIALILMVSLLLTTLIETYNLSIQTLAIYIFITLTVLVIWVLISYFYTPVQGYLEMIGAFTSIWFSLVFTVMINLGICYLFKALKYVFFPSILEIVRKILPDATLKNKTRLENFRKSLKNVFRDSSVLNNNIIQDSEKINMKKMKFTSEFRENLYQSDKIAENKNSYVIVFLLGGAGAMAYAYYNIALFYFNTYYIIYLAVFSFVIFMAFPMPLFSKFREYARIYVPACLLITQAFFFFSYIAFGQYSSLDIFCYIPVLYSIGFSNNWLEIATSSCISSIFVIIAVRFYILSFDSFHQLEIIISYLVAYFSICALSLTAGYFIDKSGRLEFNLLQKVQIEIQKTKNILSYLLPAFVRKRVKDGVRYIAEDKGTVSIIFCDIYNFEDLLRNYSPQELTSFLDDLFAKLDQKCTLSGCTKIETVGKTYMACAGLNDTENDLDHNYMTVSHARRAVEMGISIISMCENTYLKNGEKLKVKIGINSGPVTAGVVGYHKPQFSLVGDTVNTASRMASLCPGPNKIQISTESFKLMKEKSGLKFTPHNVDAKGKGNMNTYFVTIDAKDLQTTATISPFTDVRTSQTKKITMYQIASSHKESMKRRSSVLENLNEQIIDEAGEFKRSETQQLEEIKLFSFRFKESPKETEFRQETSKSNVLMTKAGLKIRVFCDLVFLALSVIASGIYNTVRIYTICKLIIELLLLLLVSFRFHKDYLKLSFSWILCCVYLFGGLLRLLDFEENSEIVFVDYLLYLLQACLCSQLVFNKISLPIMMIAIVQIIVVTARGFMNGQMIISSLVFLATLMFTMYNRERQLRIFSRVTAAAGKELVKTEELLTKMMPKNVLEKLKEQSHVTEDIHGVSILYADIAGFTQWSSNKLPDEVVNMLSNLFTEFDQKCVELDVYKVHTIGDCYVALGYTGSKVRSVHNECYNLARFALQLVTTIKTVNERQGINLNMRIGIHTGDIIGGIAGTNIVRYDIYGFDVLMANKMESNGELGKVHISQATKEILAKHYPKEFVFVTGKKVEVPDGDGLMPTYFLDLASP